MNDIKLRGVEQCSTPDLFPTSAFLFAVGIFPPAPTFLSMLKGLPLFPLRQHTAPVTALAAEMKAPACHKTNRQTAVRS